jgi:hypothetical protein
VSSHLARYRLDFVMLAIIRKGSGNDANPPNRVYDAPELLFICIELLLLNSVPIRGVRQALKPPLNLQLYLHPRGQKGNRKFSILRLSICALLFTFLIKSHCLRANWKAWKWQRGALKFCCVVRASRQIILRVCKAYKEPNVYGLFLTC